jgi:hydroxymethylbilane synthase
MTFAQSLRLGTRGSLLAQTQSGLVARQLEALHPGLRVELITIKTSGDKIQDRPLHEFGGKGLFTKELETALLEESVDFAVHSLKDVPVTMPLVDQSELVIAAIPQREDPADVLVSKVARSIDQLPSGARVGTGSLRRRCQLLAQRDDLRVEMIRGNIDTRLRKLREGEYDAVLLAAAGVRRASLFDETIMTRIELQQLLPAAGQGALALQCRRNDEQTRRLLEAMNDPVTNQCVKIERALVAALNGDCHSPIAALSQQTAIGLELRAAVGARAGELPVVKAAAQAAADCPQELVQAVWSELDKQGVMKLLGTTRG